MRSNMRSNIRSIARSITLTLGLSLAPSGCGTFVSQTPLNPAPRPLAPRPAQAVEVFSSAPPARPHVDVALLQVSQNDQRGTEVMIQTVRERAGEMGCDAIFLGGMRESNDRWNPSEPVRTTLNATCAAYTHCGDPVAPAAASPGPASRRMCHDLKDFDRNRDCVVRRGVR